MTDVTGSIVVGYDGSAEASLAVDWAAAEASRLSRPLVVTNASTPMQPIARLAGTRGQAGDAEASSGHLAEEGAERARKTADGIAVSAVTERRGASAALVKMSELASLVVVGNRGRGRVTGALLGSVAFALATHAQCPMTVVRGRTSQLPGPERPVVVGVDGSSDTALDHATDVAADTGAQLRILVGWQSAPVNPWNRQDLVNTNAADKAKTEAEQAATRIAEDAAARASSRRADLSVAPVALDGRPEQLLTDESTAAALVVVGARGRGDLASLMLGSISRSVTHRADCPVTIIR